MDVTLWFDPETGDSELGNANYDPPIATWKVIREGDAISILARNAKDKIVLLASGSWQGQGIGQRSEIGETVTDSQWGHLANVIVKVDAGEPLPGVQRRTVETVASSSSVASADSTAREPTELHAKPTTGDGRSGWWVGGAGVIALIGFFISWKAQQPYDSTGKAITVLLGILAGGLLIYSIYGGATRCPSCHAWFKRRQTSKEHVGDRTESREETTQVKDSAGNVVGSTSQYVTYNVSTYNYNYSCKACSHRWTLQSSSKSRA